MGFKWRRRQLTAAAAATVTLVVITAHLKPVLAQAAAGREGSQADQLSGLHEAEQLIRTAPRPQQLNQPQRP